MDKIFNTGLENGIEGIEKISAAQVNEIEPHVKSIGGIWVPCTGIIDFRSATQKMVELALAQNSESRLKLGHEVVGIEKGEKTSTIVTNKGKFEAEYLVFTAECAIDAEPAPAMFTARNLMPYDTPFINIGITTGETVMGGLGTIHEPEST